MKEDYDFIARTTNIHTKLGFSFTTLANVIIYSSAVNYPKYMYIMVAFTIFKLFNKRGEDVRN